MIGYRQAMDSPSPRSPSGRLAGKTCSFTLAGNITRYDGYGYMTMKLGAVLRERGNQVVSLAHLDRQPVTLEGPTVLAMSPEWLAERNLSYAPEQTVLLTMFEADRIPSHWPEIINGLAGCIVPNVWNLKVFKDCGVTIPIFVAGLGIDAGEYPLLRRRRWWNDDQINERRPYTFFWSGTPDRRKGWDLTYKAFRTAFGDSDDVRLIMHFRQMPPGLRGCKDANVEIVSGKLLHSQWLLSLRRADCFLFPTRGEGWGLPPREAAATGLPVICTRWSGTDDVDRWGLPLRLTRLVQADYGFWDTAELGRWAEPDAEHLVQLLRWCYAHRAESAARGKSAAIWLHQRQTWEQMADAVESAVREVLP